MAILSSPGVGSGLDIVGLVNKLVASEISPKAYSLDRKEASFQARLSGLGTLKGALSDFQSKLNVLGQASAFDTRSSSVSNKEAFSASIKSSASVGTYSIDVTQLAQSQSLVSSQSTPYASLKDTIGTGTLTMKFGTGPVASFVQNVDRGTHSITIDSSNNTLEGVRDAINDAGIGVTASIINNGSGYLLSMVSSKTGADASMEITVADSGDGNDSDGLGLSSLAYNATAANLTETIAAQDAALTINGIAITSERNSITEAIEGVTFDLLDTQSGTLSISLNTGSVKKNVEDFVESYNKLMTTIKSLTGYDPDTRVAGILNGDSGARSIVSNVRNIISNSVDALSGSFINLSGLGVSTQSDGSLSIDASKLQDAIDNNFDDVATLFAAVGSASDLFVDYVSGGNASIAGDYAVVISSLATTGSITANTTTALADDGAGNFTVPFAIDTDNDEFVIDVDGTSSASIVLTNGTYTSTADLVKEVQARINADEALSGKGVSVTVAFDATTDSLSFTSASYGSESKVSFSSVDINSAAELGIDTALVSTDGSDVAGTIGGVSATGSGQFLTAANGSDAEGIKLRIQGEATGDRGSIEFSRGIADQLNGYVTDFLESKSISKRIDTIEDSIDTIGDQRDLLQRRAEALETRLLAKFTAMDLLVSQLSSSGDFLNQQLSSINKWAIGGSKK